MHEPFLSNLLFSFPLHLRFFQTGLDELVIILHRYYNWLACQRVLRPDINLNFWIWQMHSISWSYAWPEKLLCTEVLNVKIVSFLKLMGCWFSLNCAQIHKQLCPASKNFANSVVQFVKGTQLLLSLALALWFRTRVGDIPAASSKVK